MPRLTLATSSRTTHRSSCQSRTLDPSFRVCIHTVSESYRPYPISLHHHRVVTRPQGHGMQRTCGPDLVSLPPVQSPTISLMRAKNELRTSRGWASDWERSLKLCKPDRCVALPPAIVTSRQISLTVRRSPLTLLARCSVRARKCIHRRTLITLVSSQRSQAFAPVVDLECILVPGSSSSKLSAPPQTHTQYLLRGIVVIVTTYLARHAVRSHRPRGLPPPFKRVPQDEPARSRRGPDDGLGWRSLGPLLPFFPHIFADLLYVALCPDTMIQRPPPPGSIWDHCVIAYHTRCNPRSTGSWGDSIRCLHFQSRIEARIEVA